MRESEGVLSAPSALASARYGRNRRSGRRNSLAGEKRGPFQRDAGVQPETERLGNLAGKSFAAERRQITGFGSGFASSTAAAVKIYPALECYSRRR